MTENRNPIDNSRIEEVEKHLEILTKQHTRTVTVKDYIKYRNKYAPQLPSVKGLSLMFNNWNDFFSKTNIAVTSQYPSRIPDSVLIAALQEAATDLGVSSLSSTAYNRWRKEKIDSKSGQPPSSTVIRKWLGFWGDATKKAGLKSRPRANTYKPSMNGIINSLQKVNENISGRLTEKAYQNYIESLDIGEQNEYPTIKQILKDFASWGMVLSAADIEQADIIHPDGLWTTEECQKIVERSEKVLGQTLTKENYVKIVRLSKTPKPSWRVMDDLLSLE